MSIYSHIMADTIEQAQIEADAVAYKNQQEELKRKFGDNVGFLNNLSELGVVVTTNSMQAYTVEAGR